ncbi:hypothetical protein F4560_004440 [Saccharothrix ecbatanensis]|uniref:Uncharacterized protein n=1 Tax=Saccharothrix ecbatanensis TaxID=1105145 RepID=A0A7W9M286_9PSEU|nr:hypothetical protein [Saccharothrix ecbatanensis]
MRIVREYELAHRRALRAKMGIDSDPFAKIKEMIAKVDELLDQFESAVNHLR